ncbi:cyclin-dependent kinase 11-like [Oratosquilla oratoria]|uniref:cyclin-dependent kinase 11-like n=1 Tax=Oratosquilla oratoria TaxID=337810 RepID=UPI003F77248A
MRLHKYLQPNRRMEKKFVANSDVEASKWVDVASRSALSGIIHFDLKPCNPLVSFDGELEIADFGLSELREDGPFEFEKVTESYRPPECYLRPETMDIAVDIWSIGVIVVELVTGEVVVAESEGWLRAGLLATLYGCKGNINRLSEVLDQKNSPPPKLSAGFKDRVSASLSSLAKRLFRCNTEERLSAEAALGHNYFWESPQRFARYDSHRSGAAWDALGAMALQSGARYPF